MSKCGGTCVWPHTYLNPRGLGLVCPGPRWHPSPSAARLAAHLLLVAAWWSVRGGVRLWSQGDEESAMNGNPERVVAIDGEVRAVAFSADGMQLAAALGDGSVRIVSSTSGEVTRSFVANRATALRAIAFSNDGKRLATGAEDGEAVLWELADGASVLRLRLAAPIASVDFNREGGSTVAEQMLALADARGTVRVVDADAVAPSPGAVAGPRGIEMQRSGGVAARFVQGRCLVHAGAAGPVVADATLGFERLFAFGHEANGTAPRVATHRAR